MKRTVPWRAVIAALAMAPNAPGAALEARSVYLQSSLAARGEHASRLIAELQSDGYQVHWQTESDVSPCSAPPSDGPRLAEARGWIDVESEPESGGLLLSVCYVAAGGVPQGAQVRVPDDDPRQLALAAVEALNGLAARPRPRPPASSTSVARAAHDAPAEPSSRRSSLFANGALVLDAGGGRPLVGVIAGLETALTARVSLELEAFAPIRETVVHGRDRELSLRAAWARAGPRLVWDVSPLEVGMSLQSGAGVVWASAETTPPLIGTTEHAAVAVLSAGLSLDCPDDGPIYLRAAARADRFVPSLELALGDGATRSYGELLLELDIGVGFRWPAGP